MAEENPLKKKSLKKKLKKILLMVAVMGGLGIALILVLNLWITLSSADGVYGDIIKIPTNSVGLVLGTGRLTRSGKINVYYQGRIEAAARLYQEGKVKHLLASGSSFKYGYNEALDMKRDLMKLGVPERAITLDDKGFRTLDSLVRAKKVYGLKSFTIITQEFHSYRSVFIGRAYGLSVVGYCAPKGSAGLFSYARWREYLARVKAVVDLYVLHTKPRVLGKPVELNYQ